jgi:peroxiredoxin
MTLRIIFIIFLLSLGYNPVFNSAPEDHLAIGALAPDFTLPFATKAEIIWDGITLSEIIGESNIILAFYPANWSGGCTQQLCNFRDNFSYLQELDATILAISGDYVFSHHEWAKQQKFPFKLLSDHLHEVGKIYESYNPERGFNKRTVFIIDKNGRIAYKNMSYSVSDESHFDAVKEALRQLL